MTDISVLGLGLMGAALASAFLKGGHRITVWNRTETRMQPLVAMGAFGASSVAAAVRSSPATLICVDNYDVTRRILEVKDVLAALTGRVLIQVSTGTPREAQEASSWLETFGVAYIDGAILCGPTDIGTDSAQIFLGGPRSGFERCSLLLGSLGRNVRYLGENVVAPAALDLAWLCQRFGLFVGLAHGVLLCESEHVDLDLYASLFPTGDRARAYINAIHAGAYEHPSATLSAWQGALHRVQGHARDAGIDRTIPDFFAVLFDRAAAAGYGEENVAALGKVLRRAEAAR